MLNGLLWVLIVVGAWDLLNMIGRIIYKDKNPMKYSYHVVLGIFASIIVFFR